MHSYIYIVAFHLGTIDEPREGCDVGAKPEDGEWWTHPEDGRMDPDVHDQGRRSPGSCSLTNTNLVLIPGNPRSMSFYFKFMQLIIVPIYLRI